MDKLTRLEERLVRCVEEGQEVDLTNDQRESSEEVMSAWGANRTVRASVIRDILCGKLAVDADPRGLRLSGARVDGQLDLRHVTAVVPLDLRACYLPSGADFSHARLKSVALRGCHTARLDLDDTRVDGPFDASGAVVSNDAGPALVADGLQVGGGLFLNKGFTATGADKTGAVRLPGASIRSELNISDATISNETGPALVADGVQVDGNLLLRKLTASGAGELGAVRFTGASIGGQLAASGAIIKNDTGPGLYADRLQVRGDLFLDEKLVANGADQDGAVRLLGASVSGELNISDATIKNETGPALVADGAQVDGNLFLLALTASGAGGLGAVRLCGVRVGGQLGAWRATFKNNSGPALYADRLQVDSDLFLNNGFTASAYHHPSVVLRDAHIGGLLITLAGIKHTTARSGTLDVNGLTYHGLPQGPSVAEWLAALAHRTPSYSAQPYQQLAAATRAAGHDGETREVLMAQRRDQIRRGMVTTGFPERTWAKATGLLLGFGYQPWRALLPLLAILAASVTLAIIAGGDHGGLTHTTRTSSPNTACTTVEQIGVGIDLGLPLIKTTARETCATTLTAAGQTITGVGYLLQAFAWAFATLFIAGFTGAVRKT